MVLLPFGVNMMLLQLDSCGSEKQMRFEFHWSTALMLAPVGSQQIMLLEQEYHIELGYGKGKHLCWHIEMDMRRNRISQFDVEAKREKNRSGACERLIRQRVIYWN